MAFCGSGKLPKNKKYGTEEQCRKAGQVRLWGNRKTGQTETKTKPKLETKTKPKSETKTKPKLESKIKISSDDFNSAFNDDSEKSSKDIQKQKFIEKVNQVIRKSEAEMIDTQKDIDDARKIIKEGEKKIQQFKEGKKKSKVLDKVMKKNDNVVIELKKIKEKNKGELKKSKKEIKESSDKGILTEKTKKRIINTLSKLQKKFRESRPKPVPLGDILDRIKKENIERVAKEIPKKGNMFANLLGTEAKEKHLKKMADLESKRTKVANATVKLQYLLRKRKNKGKTNNSDKKKDGISMMQSLVRKRITKKTLDKKKGVVSKMQSLVRKKIAKKTFDKKKGAVSKMQSLVRDRQKYKKTILPYVPYAGGGNMSLEKKNKRRKDYEDIKSKLAASYVPMTKKNRAVKMATDRLTKRNKKDREIQSNLKRLKEFVSRKK